jgi:hypothetical protein
MQAVVYKIPVFGWMLREAVYGPATAKALFAINCVLLWLLAISYFGYPAIIIPALCAVPAMLILLVVLSWPYHRSE